MDIGAYVGHGWNTFKANPGPYIVITVAVLVANALLQVAGSVLPMMLGSVIAVATIGLTMGVFVNMGLKGSRGQSVELSDVALVVQRPIDFIIAGLVVALGSIACGVGVVVTATLFVFAMFLIVQGAGYEQALKQSLETVKPRFMDVLLLVLVLWAINFVGALLCGIGLLVSIPVTFIALAKAFDEFGFGAPSAMVTPPPYQNTLP